MTSNGTWINEMLNLFDTITPNQTNIILIIIGVLLLLFIIVLAMRFRKNSQYEFDICIKKDGVNSWETIKKDTLTWKYSDTYQIEPNCLYVKELTTKLRIRHWFNKIKSSFIVVFREKKPEGIVYGDPNRSAYVLKVVEESKALGLALKEEFKQAMTFKRIFILVVLAVIIGVVYMVVTGQLSI